MKKEYCVISHTHWDREWYFTFEQFRYRLVKLMDNLLEIMEKDPKYIFHLDAQTIVLEDYLKIKPRNKEKLEKYIREGRIIPGPWYVQNDFFLTDGEATVRNLLIGSEIAESFGCCGKTGYIPDQFGNISQLPQIYNNFGIDTCLLGRGYTFFERDEEDKLKKLNVPAEFYWDSKDGSRVFAVRFTNWYNNAQRFSEDTQKNVLLIKHCEELYGGTDRIPYYLLMNGVDHLEAQENLCDVLPALNEALEDGKVYQCSMQEYTDKAHKYIKENNVPMNVMTGELRNGSDYDVLKGTLSSRVYLKIANCRAQNKLENQVEALYSMAHMLGFKDFYPVDYSKYLWKLLIENHPHDSICGCSVDAVHRNMMDRTARFNEAANELVQDALTQLTSHVSRDGVNEEDYVITVWNTSESRVSALCDIECNFPATENVEGFDIFDEKGNKAQFDVEYKDEYVLKTTSPINLPGQLDCNSYRIKLFVDSLDGMSYRTYTVRKSDKAFESIGFEGKDINGCSIENDLYTVYVDEMGRVSITDKESGKAHDDCIKLEDRGDRGDLYVYWDIWQDGVIGTDNLKPDKIQLVKNTDIEKSVVVSYRLNFPECCDFMANRRSEKMVENKVDIKLTLVKGQKWVDVVCNVDNKSSDHRLRILFDTHTSTDFSTSLVPFDTTERDRREALKKICGDGTQPNSGFVYVGENGHGVGIMNEGLYEYEHLVGEKGTVALTLLRCTGIISNGNSRLKRNMMQTFESQCIGQYEMHLGITFENTDNETAVSRLVRKTKNFQNGIIPHFQPYSVKKFTGGRPQVQDTDIAELFFRPDKYENICLGKSGKLFEIKGEALTVTAIKLSEDGKKLVVRVFNTTDKAAELEIKLCTEVASACKMTMNEKWILKGLDVENNGIKTTVKGRGIETLAFELK